MRFFRPRRPLREWQRWSLAAGGLLSKFNEEPFDQLASRYSREACLECLSAWWSIRDVDFLRETKRWLQEFGRTNEAIAFLRGDEPEWPPGTSDVAARVRFAERHRDEILRFGLTAWDSGRLVSVARWAYTGGLIADDVAWQWLREAAIRIRATYSSWQEFGAHWELGYRFWNDGNPLDEGFASALRWLLDSRESVWREIAWETDLRP